MNERGWEGVLIQIGMIGLTHYTRALPLSRIFSSEEQGTDDFQFPGMSNHDIRGQETTLSMCN